MAEDEGYVVVTKRHTATKPKLESVDWKREYPYGGGYTIPQRLKVWKDRTGDPKKKELLQEILDNWSWLDYMFPDDTCILPLISKYLHYANIDHPPDKIVDDIYNEAFRVARLARERWQFHECSKKLTLSQRKSMDAPTVAIYDLCFIAEHPKTERLDKIVDVETVISARHHGGPIFENICGADLSKNLVDTLLIMLSEE